MDRKILHIDMDAFYASVEERDNPALKGKPVIVGGAPESRGVVATANYIARKFGVHSAMATITALRLCPSAILTRPRFDAYRAVSAEVMAILRRYSEIIEPLSLDEAYLDVSGSPHCSGSATLIARAIKAEILEKTRLTATAGVSYNKFLAKIASGMNKPDGLTVIRPNEGAAFVQKLPIGKFYGIGKATEAKMHKLGIKVGADLLKFSERELVFHFGKAGVWYARLALGVDDRQVNNHRERKSLGNETTFPRDTKDRDHMLFTISEQTRGLFAKLEARELSAKAITIKVKYDNFKQVTRSRTFAEPLDMMTALKTLPELLDKTRESGRAVRLLGITFSRLLKKVTKEQAILWDDD